MAILNNTFIHGDLMVSGRILGTEDNLYVRVYGTNTPEDIRRIVRSGLIPYCMIEWAFTQQGARALVRMEYCGENTENGLLTFVGIACIGSYVKAYSAGVSIGETDYGTWYYFTDGYGTPRLSLYDMSYVITSAYPAGWTNIFLDDIDIPTSKAVSDHIASVISSTGGFRGQSTVSAVLSTQELLIIVQGTGYLTGDWIVLNEAGQIQWYPNNDRSATLESMNVSVGDVIYWIAEGNFVKVERPKYMPQFITSSLSDWDDMTVTGLYPIEAQATGVAHSPASGHKVMCLVTNSAMTITQVALSGSNANWWVRRSNQGTATFGTGYNGTWKRCPFEEEIPTLVSTVGGTYNSTDNGFALENYVKQRYQAPIDSYTGNIAIPTDDLDSTCRGAITLGQSAVKDPPSKLTTGSGTITGYRGGVMFIRLEQWSSYVNDHNGVFLRDVTVEGCLCVPIYDFIENKIGAHVDHRMYAILNDSGISICFTKSRQAGTAASYDHIIVPNGRFFMLGCNTFNNQTISTTDYYIMKF